MKCLFLVLVTGSFIDLKFTVCCTLQVSRRVLQCVAVCCNVFYVVRNLQVLFHKPNTIKWLLLRLRSQKIIAILHFPFKFRCSWRLWAFGLFACDLDDFGINNKAVPVGVKIYMKIILERIPLVWISQPNNRNQSFQFAQLGPSSFLFFSSRMHLSKVFKTSKKSQYEINMISFKSNITTLVDNRLYQSRLHWLGLHSWKYEDLGPVQSAHSRKRCKYVYTRISMHM